MKKSLLPLYSSMLLVLFGYACRLHHHNTSISISESDKMYSMKANFSESKTRKVQRYMDRCLGRYNNHSFVNTRIDGTIALDDDTRFYIKMRPGELRIKMDKYENSPRSYRTIKDMCNGIKEVIK